MFTYLLQFVTHKICTQGVSVVILDVHGAVHMSSLPRRHIGSLPPVQPEVWVCRALGTEPAALPPVSGAASSRSPDAESQALGCDLRETSTWGGALAPCSLPVRAKWVVGASRTHLSCRCGDVLVSSAVLPLTLLPAPASPQREGRQGLCSHPRLTTQDIEEAAEEAERCSPRGTEGLRGQVEYWSFIFDSENLSSERFSGRQQGKFIF